MNKVGSRPWLLVLALAAVSTLALLAACGDDDDDDGGDATPTAAATATGDGDAIDISGVPELDDGKLTVGSDIAYPPIEYFEEGTQNAVGMDVDLMKAIAAKLGVEVEFQQVADFAGIVGDVKASRYDMVMSAISITPEREAEIDFIAYFGPAGTGILVAQGNPEGIDAVEDLCGKSVGAQVGTFQVEQMEGFNASDGICADNPIDIKTFPDNPTAVQELTLGRIVAELADDPVTAYTAATSGDALLEVAVQGFDAAPYGMGFRKESTELQDAITQALAAIRADGTYDSILEEWGQSDLAYEE